MVYASFLIEHGAIHMFEITNFWFNIQFITKKHMKTTSAPVILFIDKIPQ